MENDFSTDSGIGQQRNRLNWAYVEPGAWRWAQAAVGVAVALVTLLAWLL